MYPGMWQYPRNPDLCCIYRVPNLLREVNPEAYTPQQVIIGPLHHSLKSQALRALDVGDDITNKKSIDYLNMEEHKKTYLAEFSARVDGENIIDGFRRMIEEDEEIIRESYTESTAWIQSTEFVEMVLRDSIFIIEFILRFIEVGVDKKGDPLMDNIFLRMTVYYDLILLENQLPYFILEKLFDPIILRISPFPTFREVVIIFFNFQGKIRDDSTFRHFTDLLRCVRVDTLPNHDVREFKPMYHMYSAVKLDSGGIKLEAVEEEFSLNVTFKNGCLKMPRLIVEEKVELELRNIIALEQFHYPLNAVVCSYLLFLDHLIDSDKDVDLLVEKGIIQNFTRESVAQMVKKLVVGIFDFGSYYSELAFEVNKYYSPPGKWSKVVLKRAAIAAKLILVMTLIQTVASIIQVVQNIS